MAEIIDMNGINLGEQAQAEHFWARIFSENGFHHLADTMLVNELYVPMFPPMPPSEENQMFVHIAPVDVIRKLGGSGKLVGVFFKGQQRPDGGPTVEISV